jgi:hypothetical protein
VAVSVAAEACTPHLMTLYLEDRQADNHMILVHLLVQDMILSAQEMFHPMYVVALDSRVAGAAALVGIHSVVLAAMISFEVACVEAWMGDMERALCIAGAITTRKPRVHERAHCEVYPYSLLA